MTKVRILACTCFFLSGTASISYQLLWLRDAISHFGVITPVISVLLSVFMLGLALGTYVAGRAVPRLSTKGALRAYAAVELLVAVCAICVPKEFGAGYRLLLGYGSLASAHYFLLSALIIAGALLPACALIGSTLPLMMRMLERQSNGAHTNFGMLYCANLGGALTGCILPLGLIEALGLHGALTGTTILNGGAALLAVLYSLSLRQKEAVVPAPAASEPDAAIRPEYRTFLFLTGFVAVGSEVLWMKAFAPVTSSSVYAFAVVLTIYLMSNTIGNYKYLDTSFNPRCYRAALLGLPLTGLLPIYGISMSVIRNAPALTLLSIVPLCLLFGYLTPQIVDRACGDNPTLAARAYIYNFAGCIVGPLFTGYLLFPALGLKWSFLFQACLLAVAAAVSLGEASRPAGAPISEANVNYKRLAALGFAVAALLSLCLPNYEDYARRNGLLYRDNVGYVAATGKGMARMLTVNGIGMTQLTTITKDMIYLPAAHHLVSAPRRVLIICMGMGTTLCAATKLPFDSITVVELSPGVVRAFPYFHSDAAKVLADPRVHIVVDDGRRYLLRNKEKYDIIVIDPPPPITASGSGLLYSTDFIAILADHLNDGGILAHWVPDDREDFLTSTIISAIKQHFRYIREYHSVEGWGVHVLASNSPIPTLTAQQYLARLPYAARADIQEYTPDTPLEELAKSSVRVDTRWANVSPATVPPISDDHLYNEFYVLRATGLSKLLPTAATRRRT
jgi:spermidine synthase